MTEPAGPYVLDTHALHWYWQDPTRLGPGADAAFQAIERREALGLVSVVVIAELHYLSAKMRAPLSVSAILQLIDRSPALRLEPVARRHLMAIDRLADIPEVHDRLIAAVALVHEAIVVTRDPAITSSSLLRTIW